MGDLVEGKRKVLRSKFTISNMHLKKQVSNVPILPSVASCNCAAVLFMWLLKAGKGEGATEFILRHVVWKNCHADMLRRKLIENQSSTSSSGQNKEGLTSRMEQIFRGNPWIGESAIEGRRKPPNTLGFSLLSQWSSCDVYTWAALSILFVPSWLLYDVWETFMLPVDAQMYWIVGDPHPRKAPALSVKHASTTYVFELTNHIL